MTPPPPSADTEELPADFPQTPTQLCRRYLVAALIVSAFLLPAALVLDGGGPHVARASTSGVAAGPMTYFLPHLVSGGYPTPITPTPPGGPTSPWPWPPIPTRVWPTRPPRPPRGCVPAPAAAATPQPSTLGMVSFGESVIELQNMSDSEQAVDVKLHSLNLFDDVHLQRDIAAMGAVSVELKSERAVTYSEYAAKIESDDKLGALARTSWMGGAMAVYEAPEPATELILPLFALEVYSHTTFLQITNTNPDAYDDILMQVYDSDGSILCEWSFGLEPGESGTVDPYERAEFQVLPGNVGNGFLGALRFQASQKTAIVAYGDDWEGRGVTAFRARPVDDADTEQYLPMVRASLDGNTLISVANATGRPNNVTITYIGADSSPNGAGQKFEQSFTIGPWVTGVVDLDLERPRGNVEPPPLPRGSGANTGFLGTAVITASGPVVTLAFEQVAQSLGVVGAYTILSSAAYDAFGYSDLAQSWIVPRAYDGSGGRTTQVVVMNPHARAASVRVEWGQLPNALSGTSGTMSLGPFKAVTVPIPPSAGPNSQVLVRADVTIAVVARDVGLDLDTTAYWPIAVTDALLDGLPTLVAPPTSTNEVTVQPTVEDTATATPDRSSPAAPTTAVPTATRPGAVDIYLPLASRRGSLR